MTNADERFRALFDQHYRSILGYALRRCADAGDAGDLAGETFAVTWRRIHDVPDEPEAKLWIFGVARLLLRNQVRASIRRTRLNDRLGAALRTQLPVDDNDVTATREAVAAALLTLDETDREIMELTAWEELTPAEIAGVLNMDGARVRKRLFVARRQLEQMLDDGHVEDAHRNPHIEFEQGSAK